MAKRKNAKAPEPIPDLPPALPSELEQLERAIILLGARSKGLELTTKPRAELFALIGAYPRPTTASRWKSTLKSVKDEWKPPPKVDNTELARAG